MSSSHHHGVVAKQTNTKQNKTKQKKQATCDKNLMKVGPFFLSFVVDEWPRTTAPCQHHVGPSS
jgi:hypothetical protein